MRKPKVKLLKGNHPDVVSANVSSLKGAGYSHSHATHFALRHANKGIKKFKKIGAQMLKKTSQVKITE